MTPTLLQCGTWALAEDKVATPGIKRKNTLLIDTDIRRAPEYKAILSTVPDPVAYDIGAFIGYWSVLLAEDGFTVCAFEPYPDAFTCLHRNTKQFDQVFSFEVPVGDGSCVQLAPENMLKENPGTRQCLPNPLGEHSVRLDDFLARSIHPPPHFLKIDCEGSESLVLAGAQSLIAKHQPTIAMEVYPEMLLKMQSSPEELLAILTSLDYQWRTLVGVENSVRWDILATPKKSTPI